MDWKAYERKWSWHKFRDYPDTFLEELGKTTKNFGISGLWGEI
jgi:hypothetical protein